MSHVQDARKSSEAAHLLDEETEGGTAILFASGNSSKTHSSDHKSGDVDVELIAPLDSDGARRRKPRDDDVGIEDDYDDDAGETGHLLAQETPLLNAHPEATTLQADDGEPPAVPAEKVKSVSWSSLPKKGQLAILTLARLRCVDFSLLTGLPKLTACL
jgi:hypothetical protein